MTKVGREKGNRSVNGMSRVPSPGTSLLNWVPYLDGVPEDPEGVRNGTESSRVVSDGRWSRRGVPGNEED